MNKSLLFSLTILLSSCAASVSTKIANKSYQKLGESTPVYILEKEEALPTNSEFIGDLKVGDSGFSTDCGYNTVIAEATSSAKNAGANIIQLNQVKKPTALGSTCYRITAKLYRNMDQASMVNIADKRNSRNKSRLAEDSDYALIHFYRPSAGAGAMLGYKIKDSKDSIIGRLRNGEKFVYKTKVFGSQNFSGTLETKEEVQINVERGEEYFVRCAVNMGVVLGRPEIKLTENYIGMKEYDQTN
ncbi:hypothetical protein [Kaistella jeonii]|uniref:hypothetical protein n=1 Tax=Kaistella jeonii TaxID=266749 RepID=UPI00068932B3|nr:hypothetical protein [Kaistella jeonii]SFC07566.1 hypothetical protein SAMN05421876_1062 [Kaistella jeonii]VEI95130.1 Uncharacterised protein [Kaistella jeonii]